MRRLLNPMLIVVATSLLSWRPVVADDSITTDAALSFSARVANIVEQGIAAGEMPGAVVVVADRDHVIYQQAFGDRQVEPTREPMTLDTVFDLASLTKPIATATSVMRLVQLGKIDVNQPVSSYLPEFTGQGKERITVSDLLLHVGGLIPDNALRDYLEGPEIAWQRICALPLVSSPGEKFSYSDVGFIVLGKLVERVSGKRLDRFAADEVFAPLGMRETSFVINEASRDRAAPTEQRDDDWIRGEVHDPRAHLLEGVAGHAGLFSTAGDLVRYGQMMLAKGEGKEMMLDRSTYQLMTEPHVVPRGTRTLGWDHQSPYSSNRGEAFSDAAFGHGGFTGTVIWIDPTKQRVFVFLSNRLHPDGKGTINLLAGKIATLIGTQISD